MNEYLELLNSDFILNSQIVKKLNHHTKHIKDNTPPLLFMDFSEILYDIDFYLYQSKNFF